MEDIQNITSLIQSSIEILILHAPLSNHAKSRTLCEKILIELDDSFKNTQIDLTKILSHAITPMFCCIRGSIHRSSLQKPASLRLEEQALSILANLISTKTNINILNKRASLEIFGRMVAVLGTPSGQSNTTSDESKQSSLIICSALFGYTTNSPLYHDQSKIGHFVSVLLHINKTDRCNATKLAVLDCLRHLIHNANMEILTCFYPGMVSSLCKTLVGDTLREGRTVVVATISTLERLITSVLGADIFSTSNQNNRKNATTMDQLRQVVTTATQRHVSEEDMDTMKTTETVQTVQTVQPIQTLQTVATVETYETTVEKVQEKKKQQAWLDETGLRTSLLLEKVATTLTTGVHDHWKVRKSLSRLASSVYRECRQAVPSIISVCMEIVVGHMHDENLEVSKTATEAVRTMSETLPLKYWNATQKRFRECILSLSRIARSQNETALRVRLNVAAGYAHVLGDRIQPLFNGRDSTMKLLRAMAQCLELNPIEIVGTTALVIESSGEGSGGEKSGTTVSYYEIPFWHIRNTATRNSFVRLLTTLASLCDVHDLLNVLTHPTANDWRESNAVQCTWMANALLRGAYSQTKQDQDDVHALQHLKMLCRRTIETQAWSMRTFPGHDHNNNTNTNSNTDTNSTTISLTAANTNAMVISLLLRRIGDIAATVRQIGHNFRRLLLSVAYPLLEKLSNPHPVVCQSAHSTLIRVSECCGYNGISSMLQDNMDYLVDAVCAKLRRPGERSGTALVVRSIVTQDDTLDGTGPTSALLTEVVQTLLGALDQEYVSSIESNVSGIGLHHVVGSEVLEWINVCKEISASLCKSAALGMEWKENATSALEWIEEKENKNENMKQNNKNEQKKQKENKKNNSNDDIEPEFLSFVQDLVQEQQTMARMIDPTIDLDFKEEEDTTTEDTTTEDTPTEPSSDSPLPLTPVENSIDSILRRCVHYLSSSSIHVRVSTLCTLNTGMRVLGKNESALLPLVATLWPSIRAHSKSNNVPVACRALGCVTTMAILCPDFVRARLVRELWPTLRKVLLKETKRGRRLVCEKDLMSIAGTKAEKYSGIKRVKRATGRDLEHLHCVLTTLCVLTSQDMLQSEQVLDVAMCSCRLLSMNRDVSVNIRHTALKTLRRLQIKFQDLVWYASSRILGVIQLSTNNASKFKDIRVDSETNTVKLWEGAIDWWSEMCKLGHQ